MQKENWDSLAQAIANAIDPVLKAVGYLPKVTRNTEGGGIVWSYETTDVKLPSIELDAIKTPNLEYGKKPNYVTFLRVYLGTTQLKTLQPTSAETHPFLKIGWIYADDHEMVACIKEIVVGLKQFLNQPNV